MSVLRRLEVDMAGVLGTTGFTILVIGLAQLLPVSAAVFVGAPALPLLFGALATIAAGLALLPLRAQARKWTRRESLAIVTLSWVAATVSGAVPFVAAGVCGPIDALFESISGLTTTGASIFADVDRLTTYAAAEPAAGPDPAVAPLHLWRALTHWLGGAGIVLIVLVLTPFLGDAESLRRTQTSESSLLTERYRGSTRATIKALLVVYVSLTAVNAVLLMLAGLTAWDALLHAFSTLATGGFANRTASMGVPEWGAPVQLITVAFMVIAALNFAVLGRAADEVGLLWRRARLERGAVVATRVAAFAIPGTFARQLWRHGEVRAYLLLLLGATALVTALLYASATPARYAARGAAGLWQAFVDGAFNVVSIATTTGFGTEDFTRWPAACQAVLFFLMVVGGCAGSTAGGVKMRRLLIALKYAYREVRRFAHPRAVFPIKLGDAVVPEEQVREALGYLTTYVGLIVLIGLVVSLAGTDPVTSLSASTACMGSIGPGFGEVGPAGNFQGLTGSTKLVLMLAMLLGRLEVFPVLSTLLWSFWVRRGPGRSASRPAAP